jgi:Lar family restriction alleviation protein
METELKPCPFCGGVACKGIRLPLHGEDMKYKISCSDCNVQTFEEIDIDKAIEAWNRRYTPQTKIDFDYEAED